DEIIAPDLLAVPPSGFDALGARQQLHFLRCGLAFQRLRLGQEPKRSQRSRRRRMSRASRSFAFITPRVFGTMIGVKRERAHRALAQARTQALDELGAGLDVPVGAREKVALL